MAVKRHFRITRVRFLLQLSSDCCIQVNFSDLALFLKEHLIQGEYEKAERWFTACGW